MEITLPKPFNLRYTLECGQAFRWRRIDGWYFASVCGSAVKCRQIGDEMEFFTAPDPDDVELIRKYFRLEDNLSSILSEINRDPFIGQAIRRYRGLRLLRQDPWECLVSYICSAASNVEKIGNDMDRLSERFGEQIEIDGCKLYLFPQAGALAGADIEDLRRCGIGFRAGYVKEAAEAVASGKLDLASLRRMNYAEAKRILLQYKGIGEKIADCVLLFSLDKLEAFPVDRWIRRAMQQNYQECAGASDDKIREFAAGHFGRYAGYAQEYIYQWIRWLSDSLKIS